VAHHFSCWISWSRDGEQVAFPCLELNALWPVRLFLRPHLRGRALPPALGSARPNSAVGQPRSNASSTHEAGHWFARSLNLGLTVPVARLYLSSLSEPRFGLLALSFGANRR